MNLGYYFEYILKVLYSTITFQNSITKKKLEVAEIYTLIYKVHIFFCQIFTISITYISHVTILKKKI